MIKNIKKKDLTEASKILNNAVNESADRIEWAAAYLGRWAGICSTPARMEKIPAKKRSQIARNAALARWRKT